MVKGVFIDVVGCFLFSCGSVFLHYYCVIKKSHGGN